MAKWAATYLIKSALLSQDEIDEIAKQLPRFRRRKVKGAKEEEFRRQIRDAIQGYRVTPEDAQALATRRHGTQAAGWLLGPAAVTTQADRQERLRQMILREIRGR
jgi:hypothetical protein